MAGRLTLLTLLLLVQGTAWGEVYHWMDAEGQDHFTDRPPPGKGEVVAVPSSSAGPPSSSRPPSLPDRQRLLDMYARQRAERKAAKARAAAQQAEQERKCAELTRTLRSYHRAGVLYEERPEGRRYYSTEEKDREMAALRDRLAAHCGGIPEDLRPR
jgi:hypothetical protein